MADVGVLPWKPTERLPITSPSQFHYKIPGSLSPNTSQLGRSRRFRPNGWKGKLKNLRTRRKTQRKVR